MESVNRIYFETSGVNYLFDKVFSSPDFGSLATKKLQIEKGRKWQISNVTLWEIFLTKSEDRRYDLFDFSRCLFYDTLICSPEEIIINYIKSGCPVVETQYELDSKGLFSKEWTLACKDFDYAFQKDFDYAFQPDREQLEDFTSHLRFMGDYFVKTKKGYTLKSYQSLDKVSHKINGAFLKYIHEKIQKLYGSPIDDEAKNYIAYSMQIVMIILCYGIGFDQQIIERFWNCERKIEPLERLEITVNKFPDIFFRGPLANITKMIILQSNNKTGRGLYFDSLQSIYITYSDLFVTNDDHFLKYKEENKTDPNIHKVIPVKDLNFFRT